MTNKTPKELSSEVKRLRGWIGSDESHEPALADALTELTAARILADQLNVAVPEAAESLALSSKIVSGYGPLGPYTPAVDAARLITAALQMAFLQAEAGQSSAGATYGSARELALAIPPALALLSDDTRGLAGAVASFLGEDDDVFTAPPVAAPPPQESSSQPSPGPVPVPPVASDRAATETGAKSDWWGRLLGRRKK